MNIPSNYYFYQDNHEYSTFSICVTLPRTDTFPISLVKEYDDTQEINMVNIKLCCLPDNSMLETCKFAMGAFDSVTLEGLPQILNIFTIISLELAPPHWSGRFLFYRYLSVEKHYNRSNYWGPAMVEPQPVIYSRFGRGLLIISPFECAHQENQDIKHIFHNPRNIKLRQVCARPQELKNIIPQFLEANNNKNIPEV